MERSRCAPRASLLAVRRQLGEMAMVDGGFNEKGEYVVGERWGNCKL